MSWTYDSFDSTHADSGLWNQLQNALNKIPSATQMLSAKVGTSNRISGNARGLIIYNSNLQKAPNPNVLGDTWSYKDFSTSNDYETMYQKVVQFMNDPQNGLSDAQLFYADISMSNAETHDAHVVLWYRNPA